MHDFTDKSRKDIDGYLQKMVGTIINGFPLQEPDRIKEDPDEPDQYIDVKNKDSGQTYAEWIMQSQIDFLQSKRVLTAENKKTIGEIEHERERLKHEQAICRAGGKCKSPTRGVPDSRHYSIKKRMIAQSWDKKNNNNRVHKHRRNKQGWATMTNAQKLNIAIKNITHELIECTQKGALWPVKWDNSESRTIRAAQMGNMKSLISMIRLLKELRAELTTGLQGKAIQASDDSTVVLLSEAKALLAGRGVVADI